MSRPHAKTRGWGDPGVPASGLVRLDCPGLPLRVRTEVGPLFAALLVRLGAARQAAGAVPLDSSGGFNHRPIRGHEADWERTHDLRFMSNHAWGLAVDLLAGRNPQHAPLRTDMPPGTARLAAGCALEWGGTWDDPDPMHVEFMGTPADAAAARAALDADPDADLSGTVAPAGTTTDTTTSRDEFDMASLDDLRAVILDTLRSEGVSGAADTGRPGYLDAHRTAVVEATTTALRSEGVSGAGDLGRLIAGLAPVLGAPGAPHGLSEDDVRRVAEAVSRLTAQQIASRLTLTVTPQG